MNLTDLPYGSGSVIHIPRNTLHPYCARRYRGRNQNGNPQYTVVGYYTTYEEAVEALADNAYLSANDLAHSDMTFVEVLEHYLEARQDLTEETRKSFVWTAKKYCSHLLDVRYRDIRAEDMREAISLTRSTNTKRIIKWLFTSMDREAEILDIPGKRYAQLIGTIRRQQTDTRPNRVAFSNLEMNQFLLHRNDKDMYIVLFLCYTGFRQGAFRTILKENVNLEKMTVTGGIKTRAGYMREIPIHPIIQPLVRNMMQKPGEYLLTNDRGLPMGENELYARFQLAIAPYTDRHYVLHECRHTFRNKLDEAKVEEYIVCALMGHEMPNAGQRHYAKVTLEKKREAIMKLWGEPTRLTRIDQMNQAEGSRRWNIADHDEYALRNNLTEESTLRQLFNAYTGANPSHLGEDLMRKLESAIGGFKSIMDISYKQITDDVLDIRVQRTRSDLSKTELVFLIHEFDRVTGVRHTLAFDKRGSCENF